MKPDKDIGEFVRRNGALMVEALGSHVARMREGGFVEPPYTPEEQEVLTVMVELRDLLGLPRVWSSTGPPKATLPVASGERVTRTLEGLSAQEALELRRAVALLSRVLLAPSSAQDPVVREQLAVYGRKWS